jgi:hypothetical protein
VAFKAKHGNHDPVKTNSSECRLLGQWCSNLREHCRKKLKERKIPNDILMQDKIRRLEGLGFAWGKDNFFKERLSELNVIKSRYVHSSPSSSISSKYRSSGK